MSSRCFFFGCWNAAGHYLFYPDGGHAYGPTVRGVEEPGGIHLDGTLAPRRWVSDYYGDVNEPVWQAKGVTKEERDTIHYRSGEYPQGQFLLHVLPNGFTAIQWWDRCQGDSRGACNSTVLLEGVRTVEEMLAALKEHFPHVLKNLADAGVTLQQVHLPEAKS